MNTDVSLTRLATGRDNNFNLLRIVAAASVLLTHSFALVAGTGDAEPLRMWLDVTLGTIAVDIFFVASGFLVTRSLLNRDDLTDFICARVLRIYPALILMLVLTVLALGAAFTAAPISEYFADHATHVYLAKCATLVFGVVYELPGVFTANAYPTVVNGSLWTMPYEVRMYLALAALWFALGFRKLDKSWALTRFVVAYAAVSTLAQLASEVGILREHISLRLSCMFFQGSAFYVLRDRLKLSTRWFYAALVLVVATALLAAPLFRALYRLSIGFIVLYVAYVPRGWIRQYNRVGDYSYGLYIYAFPIQQMLVAADPTLTVFQLVVASGLLTLSVAAASWHLLEKPMLQKKGRYVEVFRRTLRIGVPRY
jgi:peptidoglycan/LPS O-acetylase OafA/YrhL